MAMYMEEQLQKIAKTVYRSDGSVKVYGSNTNGQLLTVVMERNRRGHWTITEIATAGIVTGIFPAK